jgi:hypothetical protein
MFPFSRVEPKQAIGRAPQSLTIEELQALAGKFVALEIYTPEKLPLKRIAAIGDSAAGCIAQLYERGLDAREFEFVMLRPPY